MKCFLILFSLIFVHPGFAQDDDEEMLNKLDRQKTAQQAKFKKIQETTQAMHAPPSKILEQLQKSNGQLDMKQLLSPEMVKELGQFYRSINFHLMTPSQIREMILSGVKGKPMEKVFTTFPKLLDLTVAVVQDKDACPSLMNLLARQDDLQIYLYVVIGLFFLGFYLRRRFIPQKARFHKRLFKRLLISTSLAIFSFGIFYYMFQEELSPTLKVILRNV